MSTLDTDVLVIGSGAGGAVTAARLAAAGRSVTIVEEGPVDRARRGRAVLARRDGREVPPPGCVRRARQPRHRVRRRVAASAAAPRSTAVCTTASRPSSRTSGAAQYDIAEFDAATLDRYAKEVEDGITVSQLPGAAAAVVGGARARRRRRSAGARSSSPACSRTTGERGTKQTMVAHLHPARARARRRGHGRVHRHAARATPAIGSPARRPCRRLPDGTTQEPRDPGRARLRVRRRDPDARAAAAQRHPRPHRPRAEVPPDGEGRGPVRPRARPRRRADAPGHRVRSAPHDRRLGESARSRRARARRHGVERVGRRDGALGAGGRVLRGDPQRGQRPGARAPRADARRSSRTR